MIMERRTFFKLSLTSTAAGFSLLACNKNPDLIAALSVPYILSRVSDEKTIKEIGRSYRDKTPDEDDADTLEDLLMTDETGDLFTPSSNISLFSGLINKKIKNDFEAGRVVAVKGWILSVTESRQCALYSFL
jgi:hypothetical protein